MIGPDLCEREFEPHRWRWDADAVMLYALGVGATPQRDLRFVYEGAGPVVLPTFATVPIGPMLPEMVEAFGIEQRYMLHGEQEVTLHRPLPGAGQATIRRTVSDVWDKGSAAVVVVEDEAVSEGKPLFDLRSSWWVAGAGGFGGERGPSARDRLAGATGPPDDTFGHRVRDDQAALYRLSGDRSAFHIDPEVARTAGFEAPFLHGLGTLGIVALEVVAEACEGEPERVETVDARFTAPVSLGDELAISVWTELDEQDGMAVQAMVEDRPVLEAHFTIVRR